MLKQSRSIADRRDNALLHAARGKGVEDVNDTDFRRLGSLKARRLGSLEARRLGSLKARKLGSQAPCVSIHYEEQRDGAKSLIVRRQLPM